MMESVAMLYVYIFNGLVWLDIFIFRVRQVRQDAGVMRGDHVPRCTIFCGELSDLIFNNNNGVINKLGLMILL